MQTEMQKDNSNLANNTNQQALMQIEEQKSNSGLTGIRTRGLSHFSYQIARLLTPKLISTHIVNWIIIGMLTKRQSYH